VDGIGIVVQKNIIEPNDFEIVAPRRCQAGRGSVNREGFARLILPVLNKAEHEERIGRIRVKLRITSENGVGLNEAFEMARGLPSKSGASLAPESCSAARAINEAASAQ
jgi:hypothetical protein